MKSWLLATGTSYAIACEGTFYDSTSGTEAMDFWQLIQNTICKSKKQIRAGFSK
jgi:hypothetical protein